jgi:hypothetical protein
MVKPVYPPYNFVVGGTTTTSIHWTQKRLWHSQIKILDCQRWINGYRMSLDVTVSDHFDLHLYTGMLIGPFFSSETIVFNFRKLLSTLPNYAELELILLFSVNWGKQVWRHRICLQTDGHGEKIENNGFWFMSWCHNGIYTQYIHTKYLP